MAFINPWSVNNKTTAIHDLIVSKNLDLLAVTESWLKAAEGANIERVFEHELMPKSHQMIHVPRPGERRGGGIAIIHNKSIKVNITRSSNSSFKQFEYAVCSVEIEKTRIILIVLYRPVPTRSNKLKVKAFWREFEKFLGMYACCKEELILTGDLNFHLDEQNHPDTLRLNLLLEEFDLIQKIQEATHSAGHILDVLIVRTDSTILNSFHVFDVGLCNDDGKQINDHYALHWTIPLLKPFSQKQQIAVRDIQKIDYSQFLSDLAESELARVTFETDKTLSELVDLYNKTFQMLIDKHAPLKSKFVYVRSDTSWFNENISKSKKERRQSERLWRKTKLTVHHQLYRKQCAKTNAIIRKAKLLHYSDQFHACGTDQKAIHRLASSLFGGKPKSILPESDDCSKLANDFMNFFVNKVKGIRKDMQDNLREENEFQPVLSKYDTRPPRHLPAFLPTTAEEVKKFVLSSNNKSCELDPAPTEIIKKAIDLVALPMATIINKSLDEGLVPESMKKAIIRPILKEPALDPDQISNYRPVSNLSFLSKILEKIVNVQLERHLETNNLLDPSQSAYRKNHSTETVLVKVLNDILLALDRGHATILAMVDVSAAFDAVDHERLLERHNQYFGMTGKALDWMASYLHGRTQTVAVESYKSNECTVTSGFPQGSVLGGKKFTMYSSPISNVIEAHGMKYKYYADDGQEYISFNLEQVEEVQFAINKLELSLSDIHSWMTANMLKMNEDKTKIILFAPKRLLSKLVNPMSVSVHNYIVSPEPEVKNLGVMLDPTLNMQRQVNFITKSCYYQLRRISRLRKYLTIDAAKSLVNSTVLSKIDYCNSLLVNLPKYLLKKLQKIQNYAARIVKKLKVRNSVSKHLKDLHWLPVTYRIKFKIALITYKSLNNLAPQYISEMLQQYHPTRNLRSSARGYLTKKRHLNKYGSRAFSVAAPVIWNDIPLDIRTVETLEQFKTKLKIYYFEMAYHPVL